MEVLSVTRLNGALWRAVAGNAQRCKYLSCNAIFPPLDVAAAVFIFWNNEASAHGGCSEEEQEEREDGMCRGEDARNAPSNNHL